MAEKLGVWDVDALGDAMSGRLLMEWSAFRELKAEMEKQEIKRHSKGR